MNSIEKLQQAKDEIKDSFNKISRVMVTHLANKYPESYFGIFLNSILSYMERKPYEPIALFIKHVYSHDGYREKILAQDDDFFMNQTYSAVTDESKLFQTMEIWKSMDNQNKKLIKQTFKAFIERVDKYIEVLSQINSLKKSQTNSAK
jgi:quinol monooxygenase YgiN